MGFSGIHSRMARQALGLSNVDLAKLAAVGVNTISRFETGSDVRLSSAEAIRKALESKGCVFTEAGNVAVCDSIGLRVDPQ